MYKASTNKQLSSSKSNNIWITYKSAKKKQKKHLLHRDSFPIIMTSRVAMNQALKALALKYLPSDEFPPESTLESMRCQAPDEWDCRIKHALLRSENADLWKPYFPSVDDDDEIERYKIENAQLLEQAVAMFQTAWCADLVQDNLEQNILISENLEKEIAELNEEIEIRKYFQKTAKKVRFSLRA